MCLFPFMAGGSMQPVVPPTPKGLYYKNILYVLLILHITVAIMMFWVSVMKAFMELLINVMLLWCSLS